MPNVPPPQQQDEGELHPGIIFVIALAGGTAFVMFCSALFCRCYRWRQHMLQRWGQPNGGVREAPCYCYAEVWVDLIPSCMPICKKCLPRDRTAPYVAPGARYLTGAATQVTPPVRDAPPPGYNEAAPNQKEKESAAPPAYDNATAEKKDEPPYDQTQDNPVLSQSQTNPA